jgi:arginine:pyruvate transaminase
MGIAEAGDEVLLGDPMYASYEGVIAASGACAVPVPVSAANGFRIRAADIEARITPRSRVIFLNTPHNPTGAILTRKDIAEIGALAVKHDLWILSDEVYEEMVFEGETFTSPLAFPEFADRVIVVASISKAHAAPGFRSGWCIGSTEFTARLLPLAETMLFGNQPFIADMTAEAVSAPSEVAKGMRERFSRRADMVYNALNGVAGLQVNRPKAGMFTLIDVSFTGLDGHTFALDLLENAGVAVMPGSSFGASLKNWVRFALTKDDAIVHEACARIAAHAQSLTAQRAAS